ncbi:melanotransferrin-like [Actinia tenebrosa]|uniref:Melanotransferrin-like n=1 Tax=Actinia tenebrosa TaxID=6105 RepID=A0A6P8HY86_ACTTE|nr:melanotransferrin-like [Actinia tenebrosa]
MAWFFMIIFICTIQSIDAETKPFRWCTVTDDEMKKCEKFKKALPDLAQAEGVSISPGCVAGSSDEDCIKKINDNVADFITLNGGKIYHAGKTYGLVPIVSEDYGPPGNTGYFAMAVAKKQTNITINTLKGRKTCHTGYRRSAGWNIPIGYLLQGKMKRVGCGNTVDAQSAAAFFSQSCVPGVPKDKGLENLCQLCPPESQCAASSKNRYNGHPGAFKCMAEGKGEVAFLKLPTSLDVLRSEGAKYGNMSEYKYLCLNGKTKVLSPDAYKKCHLFFSPAHAVVTRSGNNQDYIKILLRASKYCQKNTTASNCSGFYIFESVRYVPGEKHLLFKDSTKQLVDVKGKNTYKKLLGEDYIKILEAFTVDTTCSGVNPTLFTSLSGLLMTIVALLGLVL